MRKILSFVALSALILLSGCSNLGTPKHLEDPEFEGWILRQCTDYKYDESVRTSIWILVSSHQIDIPGFETMGTFENAVLDYFRYKSAGSLPRGSLKEYLSYYEDEDYALAWGSDEYKRAGSICSSDPGKAKRLLTGLRKEYFHRWEEIAAEQFSVLNWALDESTQGDKYTGYLIEYEIGEGYYVLVSLIEYDNSDRYTAKILYKGNSLQEMQGYYE